MLTHYGAKEIVKMIVSDSDKFTYLAVGIGGGVLTPETESLFGECDRQEAVVSIDGDTVIIDATFVFSENFILREIGLFNSSSGGILVAGHNFEPINVFAGDKIPFHYELKVKGCEE